MAIIGYARLFIKVALFRFIPERHCMVLRSPMGQGLIGILAGCGVGRLDWFESNSACLGGRRSRRLRER